MSDNKLSHEEKVSILKQIAEYRASDRFGRDILPQLGGPMTLEPPTDYISNILNEFP